MGFKMARPPSAAHPYLCVCVSRVSLVLMETLVCLDQLERRYDINIFLDMYSKRLKVIKKGNLLT